MTHLYRFKQFSMPAANVAAQVRLRSEIAVLGAWTNTSTLDWVTAVQTGEFLKDSLIPGSTMVVTEWNVVEATDSKSGNVRYMLKEDCRPLLDLVHPEPPPTPSTDVLCETIAAVSLVNNSTALFPCSDGCCDVKIDWSSQKARLQWLSKRGESLLSALPKNRCLLYQCLDSAVAAHIPLPPDLTTKLSELTAAMQLEFRCFIDLIFLTERVLIQAYGDFNGGMLAKTCRLYEPLRIARRGYVRGAIEAFFSPSSACNMDSTDWFVSHFSNSSEMAIRCCVFAVHMLFHTTLEHILSLNDSLGAPLSLGVTAAHVFRLCDAMYFTKTASDEIDVLEPIATSSTAVGDSAVAFLMSLQLLT